MKHCLPDPEQAKNLGDYFTVFSCEYDSGERSTGNEFIIRIGEDGKIMLLLCHSCLDQLRGQLVSDFMYPIILNAIKQDKNLLKDLISSSLKQATEDKNG